MITGIVVALREELTTLTSKKIDKGHCLLVADKLLLAYSGAGAVNAKAAAELLVAQGAARLISWGCAAGLSSALNPGDLILADELMDDQGCGDARFSVSTEWHNHTKKVLTEFVDVHSGRLAESVNIVSSSKDKKQLHLKTGADALDMETIAVAKVAKQCNLPFLAIRVIADPVNMNLPQAINYSLNNLGDIVLRKLFFFLLLHPGELPGLIRLGVHFNAAKKTLKSVARHLDTVAGFNYSPYG